MKQRPKILPTQRDSLLQSLMSGTYFDTQQKRPLRKLVKLYNKQEVPLIEKTHYFNNDLFNDIDMQD